MNRIRPRSILLGILFIAFSGLPASAVIHVEAETYFNYGQIDGCGYDITRHACSGASGGYGVDGVDCDGEWIEFQVTTETFAYQVGLRSAGEVGLVRTFRFDFMRDDAHQTRVGSITLVTPPGSGVS